MFVFSITYRVDTYSDRTSSLQIVARRPEKALEGARAVLKYKHGRNDHQITAVDRGLAIDRVEK